ncbi:5-formyltetrahydrofolate cyclo-ligase [Corynebacterium sp. P5848]|uniref:5-formyltetrahydrofolate cyclo-ligase n=1 Tax=Corynebacterium marambiense TaxID=2765364 RepID=UPI002260C0CD|nr:5-formyltetrahydrofolate cyclo-ligase [Corynebacterium marambiense]MCX7542245.1 5-formyltetrahydrofolate cyclo-ligase [Corynebacterium marambiense]
MDIRVPQPSLNPFGVPSYSKDRLRRTLLDARESLPVEQRRDLDTRLIAGALRLVQFSRPTEIAAYSPMPGEPGGDELVEALLSVVPGVWLPVSGSDGRLEWALCESAEELHRGRFGIAEPVGPRVGAVPGNVELLLCPALACSVDGVRLGRGAGYFDRALADVDRSRCRIIALIYDSELLGELPAEAHDAPVDGVLTPGGFHSCTPCGT